MTTEENIVYQLLNTIRAAELTNDEVITERRIRSLLRTHRASIIAKATLEGVMITDQYFQKIDLNFTKVTRTEWTSPVPTIIRLNNNFGTKFKTYVFTNVPIVDEEEYYLSRKHLINKHQASAKIEERLLTLRVPSNSTYIPAGSTVSQSLKNCLITNNHKMNMRVVLDNPNDASNYDWTKSEYPCSSELIQVIKESILRKEFSIILQTK